MSTRLFSAALLTLFLSGSTACGGDPLAPELPTTTVISYASRLQEHGSAWRSVTVPTAGSVTVQLASVSQTDAVMGLGIGTIDGGNCVLTQSIQTAANSSSNAPQITIALGAGTYCVKISDVGNLTTIVDFLIVIVTPI